MTIKCKLLSCNQNIGLMQGVLSCIKCKDSHHRTCHPKVPNKEFAVFKLTWMCPRCAVGPSVADRCDAFAEFDVEALNSSLVFHYLSTECQVLDIEVQPPEFSKGLHIGHINLNGISNKIDELRDFLVKTKFLVCGVTETKLRPAQQTSTVNIPGYNILRFDRETRAGGGSIIYIEDNLKNLPLVYNVKFPLEVEVNCVQLFPNFRKPLIVVIIYNPPKESLKKQFLSSLESLLVTIQEDKLDYFVLGDFNIDLKNRFNRKYLENFS